ncbi:ABC transporter permease [Dactylosporangium sp. NPDC050588]|uniref:ABC transporter permease n=1 Tax=Dactylosporangium sp. NPDC050588 TaxID=3157211 RepID=UPI0033E16D6F
MADEVSRVRWLLRRLAGGLGVLLGAATVTFLAMELIPGDPARALVGSAPATPQTMALIRHEMGLDLPLPARYGHYLARLASGDLGRSYQLQQPVSTIIGEQVWPTVQLALAATLLAFAGAVLVATLTAGRWRVARGVAQAVELVAVSTPSFWLGLLLLSVFAFRLRLVPVGVDQGPAALILPAVTLAVPVGAILTQVLRDGMEGALRQPFVVSVRARGVGELGVRARHVLRHGLSPAVTLSGWLVGHLLGGAVLVETVFARPGLGRVTLAAISSRDFPVVIAMVLFVAVVFVVVSTLVDGLYRIIDPRLREATP